MKITALASLVGTGVFAASASAEIVHFVNPAPGQLGHYDWRWVEGVSWESWLDITRSPNAQPIAGSGSAIVQSGDPFNRNNMHQDGAYIAQDEDNLTLALPFGASFHGLANFNESIHWAANTSGEWTNFTPGIRQYIGVRTSTDHYGWIEVSFANGSLTAHSWAYETQPGVAIAAGQVPAPGAAAVLAVGLIATNRRRWS